jgi:hypothetical protein
LDLKASLYSTMIIPQRPRTGVVHRCSSAAGEGTTTLTQGGTHLVVGQPVARVSKYGTWFRGTRRKTDAAFKDAVDKLIQSGLDLDAAEVQVTQLEAALIKAKSSRDARRNAYDKAYGLCSTNVENYSTKPEDVHGFGFAVLTRTAQAFGPPVNIEAKYDAAKEVLRIRVLYTSGQHQCAIEISPDPASPESYTRLDGTGVIQTLSGYAPGTWWVRAATLRSKGRSEWFGPVAVVVK